MLRADEDSTVGDTSGDQVNCASKTSSFVFKPHKLVVGNQPSQYVVSASL